MFAGPSSRAGPEPAKFAREKNLVYTSFCTQSNSGACSGRAASITVSIKVPADMRGACAALAIFTSAREKKARLKNKRACPARLKNKRAWSYMIMSKTAGLLTHRPITGLQLNKSALVFSSALEEKAPRMPADTFMVIEKNCMYENAAFIQKTYIFACEFIFYALVDLPLLLAYPKWQCFAAFWRWCYYVHKLCYFVDKYLLSMHKMPKSRSSCPLIVILRSRMLCRIVLQYSKMFL